MKTQTKTRAVALIILLGIIVSTVPIISVNAEENDFYNPELAGKIAVSKTATFFISSENLITARGNLTKGTSSEVNTANLENPSNIVLPDGKEILKIESGHHHLLILTTDGLVYALGNNEYGQLGNDLFCSYTETPIMVSGLNNIKDISADGNQSFAVKEDGTLYGWGRNNYYQVHETSPEICPVPIEIATNVDKVEAGVYATYYLSGSSLYSKGYGTTGLLGYDYYGSNPVFTYVRNGVYMISAGINHIAILNSYDEVEIWGNNDYGQSDMYPNIVIDHLENPINKLGASGNSSYMIMNNGDAYVWGDNRYGQLGLPYRENTETTKLNDYLDNSNKNTGGRFYCVDKRMIM